MLELERFRVKMKRSGNFPRHCRLIVTRTYEAAVYAPAYHKHAAIRLYLVSMSL